ncbi:predicted protein [Nematostella vectensis]|uniref:Uncharacterized protein n=1 Tax=Nematostella vectensis TaxID=45351 RepID=A7RQE7_NEMVE|nr:extended synaptotagmin-3 [Nematostella vectensis]EDO46277.1 predicted protein [Nematostella vectensis]|eukprot:XP_001638340.1 predicted protein [Nematostella vectensis]
MSELGEKISLFRKEFFSHFFTFLGWFVLAWIAWAFGALHLSFAWLVLFLFIGAFLQSGHLLKSNKRKIHRVIKQENDVKKVWPNMPSWIYFSEEEHALWLNRILDQMWPYVEDMVQGILKHSVEPAIQSYLPAPLQSLCFEKMALGQTPLYITNIKTYKAKKRDKEFIMDLDVVYNGDAHFTLGIKKVQLGISDLKIHGPLRVILKPLLSDYNPVGGVTVFFLNRPKISFDLTNLLSVLDIPGLKGTLLDIVEDVVASFVVLPNRIAVPLSASVDAGDLQYPIPDGVLRVEVIEAKDLIAADMALLSKPTSDPYCIVEVGAQKYRTKTKKSNCDPVWKETFEAFIDNTEGQELFCKVYDEDIAGKDTEIGEVDVQVASAFENGKTDLWLHLEGVEEGRIHLGLKWFSLSPNPSDLRQATPRNPTVAALFVKIINAIDLPKDMTSIETPTWLLCKVNVGKTSKDTFQVSSAAPTWSQGLRFLISDPRTQNVKISILEGGDKKVLGYCNFDLKRIANVPGMSHEGAFPLQGPGLERTALKCRVVMRALRAHEPKPVEPVTPATKNSVLESHHDLGGSSSTSNLTGGETDGGSASFPRGAYSTTSLTSSTAGFSSELSVGPSIGPSTEELSTRGEVKLTLKYDHGKNRLLINIIRAERLRSRYPENKTNPFVRLYLLPDRTKKTRRRTGAVRGSLAPSFNETIEYCVGLDQLKDRDLDIEVKNARPGLSMRRGWNSIGRTTIQLSELSLSAGITMTCELKK